MARVRFNHMELTVPRGSFADGLREDLRAFFGGVLGWEMLDVEIVGGTQLLMRPDDGQFILVAEHDRPMSSPGYDHLGLLCDTRAEVDEILEQCRAWQQDDDRMRLKVYDDLVTGNVVVHALAVRRRSRLTDSVLAGAVTRRAIGSPPWLAPAGRRGCGPHRRTRRSHRRRPLRSASARRTTTPRHAPDAWHRDGAAWRRHAGGERSR